MTQVDIEAAAKDLHGLVERARSGEEVVLVENGEERARLVAPPFGKRQHPRWGLLAGKARVPSDFDAPLPDEVLDSFEGR